MVQSDVPQGRTKSGKVNARWYLQRLRSSALNRQSYLNNYVDNDGNVNKNVLHETIRVVRGSTATQGQHIPRILLKSPTKSFENEPVKQAPKSPDYRRSASIHISSASTSLKSISTINKFTSSGGEFKPVASNRTSAKIQRKDDKESVSERRSSASTLPSMKADVIGRPPSTPVDPRCNRAYSSTINPIDRQACVLLGPQLCSDCIEVQARASLSPEHLPANLMSQRLSALAIRRFVKNEENLTDDDLLRMVNNQQIQMTNRSPTEANSSIVSDDEYFERLSSSLSQNRSETPFYYKDFNDLARKYQNNTYDRLLLSETPAPTSSNAVFKESKFEKFNVSHNYAFMKRAPTKKPNLTPSPFTFLPTRQTDQFYKEHRYLTNYSPPLLLQSLQETVRLNSDRPLLNSSNQYKLQRRSIISQKTSQPQTIDV